MITQKPRPNNGSGNSEYYAILFRKGRIAACDGWKRLMYHEDNDGSGLQASRDLFRREPAYGCFQTHIEEPKIGFDFIFAAFHARWDEGDTQSIGREAAHLKDVFGSMGTVRQGERDLILAGDFNLNPSELERAIEQEVAISGLGSTLNSRGERTQNIYDYILVHDTNATSEMTGQPRIVDIRGVVADGRTFYNTVSDHLPVVATFRTDGPDDD